MPPIFKQISSIKSVALGTPVLSKAQAGGRAALRRAGGLGPRRLCPRKGGSGSPSLLPSTGSFLHQEQTGICRLIIFKAIWEGSVLSPKFAYGSGRGCCLPRFPRPQASPEAAGFAGTRSQVLSWWPLVSS